MARRKITKKEEARRVQAARDAYLGPRSSSPTGRRQSGRQKMFEVMSTIPGCECGSPTIITRCIPKDTVFGQVLITERWCVECWCSLEKRKG